MYALAGFSGGALVVSVAILLDPGLRTDGLMALVRPVTVLAFLSPVMLAAVGYFVGRPALTVVRAPTPHAAPRRNTDATIQQLQRQLAEARKASKAKSDFLASMSHELRTPLNAIIGYSEMMAEDVQDGEIPPVDDLERVTTSAKHLLELINNILDLSKIEVGKMSVLLEPVSVRRLLDDVQVTTAPLAEKKGNAFEVELDPGLRRVRGDHMRLRQILINLLSNAFKFTEGGTVRLVAKRVKDEKGMPWARISVIDTGIGMSEEQVALLFADYTQASSDIKRKYGGTGLGLAICQRFAQMMFGKIEVESTHGEGSTFTLALPVADLDDEPSVEGAVSKPVVWIVDPDPLGRRLVPILEKAGFDAEIVGATDTLDGAPSLVLVDVDTDAESAWRLVEQLAPIRRVIVASIEDDALDRASGLGASFLPKPIDGDLLVSRIGLMLRT